MKNPFKIRARSVQDPFKIRSRFVQDPFKIHSKSLQNPFKICSKFFQVSFKIHGITVQEPGTLYHIGAGALFPRASLNKLATQTNTQHEHRLHLAPKEEDVPMGSATAKTLTANPCETGLAGPASRHRTASCATGCTCEIAICLKSAPLAAQGLMQPRLADCRVSSFLYTIVYIVWGLQRSASKAHLDVAIPSGPRLKRHRSRARHPIDWQRPTAPIRLAKTIAPTEAMPRGSATIAQPTFATVGNTISNGLNPRTRRAGAAVAATLERAPWSFGACFFLFRLRCNRWAGAAAAATRARSRWSLVLLVVRFTLIVLVFAIAFVIVIVHDTHHCHCHCF
jgi:hypothetical protein